MSDKRRDHKGRVLRTGESQRADLRYQFRYKDARGNRRSIYSMDLKELRAKEEEVLSAARQAWITRRDKSRFWSW